MICACAHDIHRGQKKASDPNAGPLEEQQVLHGGSVCPAPVLKLTVFCSSVFVRFWGALTYQRTPE